MVHQNTQPAARARTEGCHGAGEVVDAVQRLHDDAFHPEVVAPDFFDEFGVVLAFHPDPAGLRHLGPLARHPYRPGRCPCGGRGGAARSRRQEPDRLTLQQETESKPEGARFPAPVFERYDMHAAGLFNPGHGADPAGLHFLQHHAVLYRHLRQPAGGRGGQVLGSPVLERHLYTRCFALGNDGCR